MSHRAHATYGTQRDDRHDIAVVRLAERQVTPGIRLAATEPRVRDRVVTVGWGCTNAPPECLVRATTLQVSAQTVLRDASCGRDVFWLPPFHPGTNVCTKVVAGRPSTEATPAARSSFETRAETSVRSGSRHSARTARPSSTRASPRFPWKDGG